MNIYAFISLISSILCLFLGNFIYYKNPKNKLNQLTALMCIMLAYFLFVEFGYRQAETYTMANMWISASFIGPLVVSLILHVVLLITKKSTLTKNKLFLLYLPSLIISILNLNYNLYAGAVKEYWGWTYSITFNMPLFYLNNLWVIFLFSISIILSYRYYVESEGREKKLAKYMLSGLSITLLLGLITDIILPLFSIRIPELYYTASVIGILFLCYGIIKYRIPQLTPSAAADEIVSTMSNFLILIDEKEIITSVNSAGLKLLGYKESELLGKNVNVIFPGNSDLFKINKLTNDFEINIKNKEGKSVPVIMSITPIIHNSQKLGVLCTGNDITKLKDEELNKQLIAQQTIERQSILLGLSRENQSDLYKTMQKLTETSSKTLNVHRVSVWLFNMDKTKIICKDIYDLKKGQHESGSVLEAAEYPNYFKAIKKSHIVTANNARNYHDTSEFNESYFKSLGIYSLMDVPIWLEGELVGVMCHEQYKIREWTLKDQEFASSIAYLVSLGLETSERKKTERKLKDSLKEKELLMKEIHHRVKNNLTVISGLLRLQSHHIKDKETLDIFKESQNRAKSMALIHEKLYKSNELRKIDFKEYIKSLTTELFYSYNTSPEINLNLDIADVYMDVNISVPLALIINEIVSNSLKHAFPRGSKGNISVNFHKKAKEYELIIADDGIGFPSDLDYKFTDSLGMHIVNNLTEQIKAQITLEKEKGTKFIINFKEN